ncbi:uncharacterized protein LOC144432497 [Glandiceps talaboti]
MTSSRILIMSFRTAVLSGFHKAQNVQVLHNYQARCRTAVILNNARFCSDGSKSVTKTESSENTEQAKKDTYSSGKLSASGHRPTEVDKTLLVWTGKFKSKEEIPDFVSDDTINKAKSITRIYVNIGMGVVLLVCIGFMIRKGRQDVASGESLALRNMRRHPDVYQGDIEVQLAAAPPKG